MTTRPPRAGTSPASMATAMAGWRANTTAPRRPTSRASGGITCAAPASCPAPAAPSRLTRPAASSACRLATRRRRPPSLWAACSARSCARPTSRTRSPSRSTTRWTTAIREREPYAPRGTWPRVPIRISMVVPTPRPTRKRGPTSTRSAARSELAHGQPLLGRGKRFRRAEEHHHIAGLQCAGFSRSKFRLQTAPAYRADFDPEVDVADRATDRGRAGFERHRVELRPGIQFIAADEKSLQQPVALAAHLAHAAHDAAERHAHPDQRVRREHQTRLERFGHHFRGARGG